jgi:hypothetical protein
MDVPAHYHEAPVQRTPPETNESVEIPPQVPPTPVFAEITPPVPATPKLADFLTPPPTEEERPKLKRNFFHNWVDSADWKESDLAMMKPKEKERYERFLLNERPKYIPMRHEDVAKLSPEDRQEYENSLKITKTPKRYALRSRLY